MIDSKRLTAWYNFQAPAYHLWRDNYDSPLVQRVAAMLEGEGRRAQQRIVDCGCGSGLFTIGLAKRLPGNCYEGIDPSTGLLAIARRQAARRGLKQVTFAEGDVMRLPHDAGSADAIIAAGLFPNINDHRAALAEMARVLKPDGTLIVVEFDRATMTAATKLFFHGMIAAYKTVSWVFRRFRFADKWDAQSSTIHRGRFEEDLHAAGFELRETLAEHSHLVFRAGRQAPA